MWNYVNAHPDAWQPAAVSSQGKASASPLSLGFETIREVSEFCNEWTGICRNPEYWRGTEAKFVLELYPVGFLNGLSDAISQSQEFSARGLEWWAKTLHCVVCCDVSPSDISTIGICPCRDLLQQQWLCCVLVHVVLNYRLLWESNESSDTIPLLCIVMLIDRPFTPGIEGTIFIAAQPRFQTTFDPPGDA